MVQRRKRVKRVLPKTSGSKALRKPLPGNWLAQLQLSMPIFFSREPKAPPELNLLMDFANTVDVDPLTTELFSRRLYEEWLDQGQALDSLSPDNWATLSEFAESARAGLTMLARNHPGRPITFPWHLVSQWDLTRIRICEVCQKFFWATRNNRLTCSKRCGGTRRQRRFRKHQKVYEENRKLKGAKNDQ